MIWLCFELCFESLNLVDENKCIFLSNKFNKLFLVLVVSVFTSIHMTKTGMRKNENFSQYNKINEKVLRKRCLVLVNFTIVLYKSLRNLNLDG